MELSSPSVAVDIRAIRFLRETVFIERERHSDRQKTDRDDRQETDKRQTETDRDRQRQTENIQKKTIR